MKSLEELLEDPDLYAHPEGGLVIHACPITNFYAFYNAICPFCGNQINWGWSGPRGMPGITNPVTTRDLTPEVKGAALKGYGFRWIRFKCECCKEILWDENFDDSPAMRKGPSDEH